MIRQFRHKGLKRLFEDDDRSKVRADQAEKIGRILPHLNRASEPVDMDLPGYKLHPLSGDRKGTWAVWVNGNWRITWRFVGPDAEAVDLEDYH